MHRGGCSKQSFAIVLSLFLEKTAKNNNKQQLEGYSARVLQCLTIFLDVNL